MEAISSYLTEIIRKYFFILYYCEKKKCSRKWEFNLQMSLESRILTEC